MKRLTVKVYDKAGTTFKGTYGQLSTYSFSSTINGGVGELNLQLPRTFDEYNSDNTVNLLDEVQIWVQDKDTVGTSGVRIYSGYISRISTGYSEGRDFVQVSCLGYVSRLARSLDWNGTTLQVARNSQDPADMVMDIIDKYQINNDNSRITYTAGTSVVDCGFTVTYQSDSKSCLESIEKVRELAGSNYYWNVDANNLLSFKAFSTTADHTFTIGREISSFRKEVNIDDLVNTVLFWNGLQEDDTNFISKRYYSGTSRTAYWESFSKNTDSRITTTATADKFGDAFVEANKDPNVLLEFTLKDNNFGIGYDIESVKCGQTCKILNTADTDLVGVVFTITRITYTPEQVSIICEDKRSLTGRRLADIKRNLDSAVYSDGISTVTSVDTD
jgi:hypothetical protein